MHRLLPLLVILIVFSCINTSAQEVQKTNSGSPVSVKVQGSKERNYVNILAEKAVKGELESYFIDRFGVKLYHDYPDFPKLSKQLQEKEALADYQSRLTLWLEKEPQFLARFK